MVNVLVTKRNEFEAVMVVEIDGFTHVVECNPKSPDSMTTALRDALEQTGSERRVMHPGSWR